MLPSCSEILDETISRNFHQISPLVYTHPHLHLSIIAILSCGVKLISSSEWFFSSDTEGFSEIALQGSISNGFSVFICLIISSSISEEILASKKRFSAIFFHNIFNFYFLFLIFIYIFLLNIFFFGTWWCQREWPIYIIK